MKSDISLLAAISILLAGCSLLPMPPMEQTEYKNMPWVGPQERAVIYEYKSRCYMCPTGARVHESIKTPGGDVVDNVEDLKWRAKEFLYATKMGKEFPRTNVSGGGYDDVYAPFDFTVVSVDPVVIIMQPYTKGITPKEKLDKYAGWQKNEVSSQNYERRRGEINKRPGYFGNRMAFTTILPDSRELLWFSPGLNIKPTQIAIQDPNQAEIKHGFFTLRFKRANNQWYVTRH